MNFIKSIFDKIFIALTWFTLFILVVQTLLTFSNVFCRYILNFSVYWADEVSLILLIWFTFIALAIGVRKKVHVAIEFIIAWLPQRILDNVVARVVDVLTCCFGVVFIYFGIKLCMEGTFSTLPATNLPSYFEYIFIPVSGVLVVYSAIEDFFRMNTGKDCLDEIFMNREGEK